MYKAYLFTYRDNGMGVSRKSYNYNSLEAMQQGVAALKKNLQPNQRIESYDEDNMLIDSINTQAWSKRTGINRSIKVKIQDSVTNEMLDEIKNIIEEQESSDRATEDESYELQGEHGFYIVSIKATQYSVDSITIKCVDTDNLNDANKLKLYLLKHNLSQVDLANQLGITKQALEQFINGKRSVPNSILNKLN